MTAQPQPTGSPETASSVNHDQADIWIDAGASHLVDRLAQYAGMTVTWSGLRSAIQREVSRQLEPQATRPDGAPDAE